MVLKYLYPHCEMYDPYTNAIVRNATFRNAARYFNIY